MTKERGNSRKGRNIKGAAWKGNVWKFCKIEENIICIVNILIL